MRCGGSKVLSVGSIVVCGGGKVWSLGSNVWGVKTVKFRVLGVKCGVQEIKSKGIGSVG